MTHCCAANVYTNVHSQPRLPSRNTAAFEGRAFCLHGNAHIRQYHRVFLNPYYGSRRTCVPLSGRSRALTKAEKAEKGSGSGEKRERIQFLGCILKSVDLSTVTRANIGGGKVDELRSLLFVCMSTLTSNPIRLISSFFLHSFYVASGTPFISSLSFLAQRYMGRLDLTSSHTTRARAFQKSDSYK